MTPEMNERTASSVAIAVPCFSAWIDFVRVDAENAHAYEAILDVGHGGV
jgi:hypothetical protein